MRMVVVMAMQIHLAMLCKAVRSKSRMDLVIANSRSCR